MNADNQNKNIPNIARLVNLLVTLFFLNFLFGWLFFGLFIWIILGAVFLAGIVFSLAAGARSLFQPGVRPGQGKRRDQDKTVIDVEAEVVEEDEKERKDRIDKQDLKS